LWPGIRSQPYRGEGAEFLLGCREIGHVHDHERVDIPFPRSLRDELVAAGRARPHPLLKQSGWVSIPLDSSEGVQEALALLRLSYDLALLN
jgi:hypothetical protein